MSAHTFLAATSGDKLFMLLPVAIGVLVLMGSMGKADWWYESAKVQRLVGLIGDRATRIFLMVSGVLLIIVGMAASIFGDG